MRSYKHKQANTERAKRVFFSSLSHKRALSSLKPLAFFKALIKGPAAASLPFSRQSLSGRVGPSAVKHTFGPIRPQTLTAGLSLVRA